MNNSESFFANTSCKYFPCHEGISPGEFNCLFCYCPLYMLGAECGGDFFYTKTGRKSCVNCTLPHQGDKGAQLIASHFEEIARRASCDAEQD